jgi:hypothetical protein
MSRVMWDFESNMSGLNFESQFFLKLVFVGESGVRKYATSRAPVRGILKRI